MNVLKFRFVSFPQEQKLWDEIKSLLAALQSDIVEPATQTKKGDLVRKYVRTVSNINFGYVKRVNLYFTFIKFLLVIDK